MKMKEGKIAEEEESEHGSLSSNMSSVTIGAAVEWGWTREDGSHTRFVLDTLHQRQVCQVKLGLNASQAVTVIVIGR